MAIIEAAVRDDTPATLEDMIADVRRLGLKTPAEPVGALRADPARLRARQGLSDQGEASSRTTGGIDERVSIMAATRHRGVRDGPWGAVELDLTTGRNGASG